MLRRKTEGGQQPKGRFPTWAGSVEEITALSISTNAIEFSGLFSHTKQKAVGCRGRQQRSMWLSKE